jgi:uncharacterized protein (DUF1800 family)
LTGWWTTKPSTTARHGRSRIGRGIAAWTRSGEPRRRRLVANAAKRSAFAPARGLPRRLQPVVDKFFYGLRANSIETQRLGVWWANRMLTTSRPLEEKLTLFWHGHFATGDAKVRDYRMMLAQNQMLRATRRRLRDLLVGSEGSGDARLSTTART